MAWPPGEGGPAWRSPPSAGVDESTSGEFPSNTKRIVLYPGFANIEPFGIWIAST